MNILRVRRNGILSRHRHAGPVHALTLRGRWHCPEHDWEAEPCAYSYEPPGDVHTLEVPDGVEEMTTLSSAASGSGSGRTSWTGSSTDGARRAPGFQ